MYCKGLTVTRIAELCGAGSKTVARHIRVQRKKFPDMQEQHESNRPRKQRAPAPSWLAKLDLLAGIQQVEGRFPTTRDPDPNRRQLAFWLSVQRRAQRDGTLTPEQLAALEVIPSWMSNQRSDADEIRWGQRLTEVQAFKDAHDRWPRWRNAPPDERPLGVWLHAQRQNASNKELTTSHGAALDAQLPGWNTWKPKTTGDIRSSDL